jgi:hypothetical protein
MPVYEIVNPSDPYTIEGNLTTVAIAVTILGRGMYSLRDEDGEIVLPFFAFQGTKTMNEWFNKQCRKTAQEYMDSIPNNELAECLESVVIGNFKDRETYFETLEKLEPSKRKKWASQYHEKTRSSLNDIGRRAKKTAKELRERDND